jgi:hypothetical protein
MPTLPPARNKRSVMPTDSQVPISPDLGLRTSQANVHRRSRCYGIPSRLSIRNHHWRALVSLLSGFSRLVRFERRALSGNF